MKIIKKVIDLMNEVLFWITIIGILLLPVIFCISNVHGRSMQPTLQDNNLAILQRDWSIKEYKRFDIITFKHIEDGISENYMKRIIGLPNEHIKIEGYDVYINGEKIEQSFLDITEPSRKDFIYLELSLGEDEYFVMGDNRNNSKDSRDIGAVKSNQIRTKLIYRFKKKKP